MRSRREVMPRVDAKLAARAYASSVSFLLAFDEELERILEEMEKVENRTPDEEDARNNLRLHLGLAVGKPGAPVPEGELS